MGREPFDFIDFLSQLRLENKQVRLPKVLESWRESNKKTGDPLTPLLSEVGRVTPGAQIPLVKQIAVLNQLERLHPEWVKSSALIDRIAKLVAANRESLLEPALDLNLNAKQLTEYLEQVERLDKLPASPARNLACRSFQATIELLRELSVKSALPASRISYLADKFLEIDPTQKDYELHLVGLLRNDVLNVQAQMSGREIESRLLELLFSGPAVEVPESNPKDESPSNHDSDEATVLVWGTAGRARIDAFLSSQMHTSLAAVLDGISALDLIERDPNSTDAVSHFKAAIAKFAEDKTPQENRKKRSKQPAPAEPDLKETASALAVPVNRDIVAKLRSRVSSYLGEALLAHVYALSVYARSDRANLRKDLIKAHDFTAPWQTTQFSPDGHVSGNLASINQVMARLSARSSLYGKGYETFVEKTLSSYRYIERQSVTRDAHEFVARMIDLGEDVLALYKLADQSATVAFRQLNRFMTHSRTSAVVSLADSGEIEKAIHEVTLSELYALGSRYLDERLNDSSLEQLKREPGALGALADIISRNPGSSTKEISPELRRGINQFGVITTSRSGLAQLELIDLEPYEYGVGFRDLSRLSERIQDLKLAVARLAHRAGGGPGLALDFLVAESVLQNIKDHSQATTGETPTTERNWQDLVGEIRKLGEPQFRELIDRVLASNNSGRISRKAWNEIDNSGSRPVEKKPE
jgi:hypothetical protein